ncbi:MAG: hypothetical protein V7641_2219 [Blastocatellia bacterium]
MQEHRWTIECARCRATKLELITGDEAKGMTEETRPIYRLCERCERTTAWIKVKIKPALAEEKPLIQQF